MIIFDFSFRLQDDVDEPVSTNDNEEGELHIQETSLFPDDNDDGDVDKKAISWGKLPKDQWYKIVGKRDLTTLHGDAKILMLKNREDETFDVWATSLIRDSVDAKWNEKDEGLLFIKAIGGGKKKANSGPFSYYDYKYKIIKKTI